MLLKLLHKLIPFILKLLRNKELIQSVIKKFHVKPEYVIISDNDKRTYFDKWNDLDYLLQVREIENNKVFKTEIIQELIKIREKADVTKNPDELLGLNFGIAIIKNLLYCSARARQVIAEKKEYEDSPQ